MPWEGEDYEFTSGVLSNNGKDVEFKVDVNQIAGQYSVSATGFLEIKVRAAQLFAGMSGKDLALRSNAEPRPAPARAPTTPPGDGKPKPGRGRYC